MGIQKTGDKMRQGFRTVAKRYPRSIVALLFGPKDFVTRACNKSAEFVLICLHGANLAPLEQRQLWEQRQFCQGLDDDGVHPGRREFGFALRFALPRLHATPLQSALCTGFKEALECVRGIERREWESNP